MFYCFCIDQVSRMSEWWQYAFSHPFHKASTLPALTFWADANSGTNIIFLKSNKSTFIFLYYDRLTSILSVTNMAALKYDISGPTGAFGLIPAQMITYNQGEKRNKSINVKFMNACFQFIYQVLYISNLQQVFTLPCSGCKHHYNYI